MYTRCRCYLVPIKTTNYMIVSLSKGNIFIVIVVLKYVRNLHVASFTDELIKAQMNFALDI